MTIPDPDKPALRRQMRAARRAFVAGLDDAGLNLAHESLAALVLPRLGDARVIAGYVAAGAEVDPLPILIAARAQGRAIALPLVESREAPMRFVRWTPGDPLAPAALGLMQPAPDSPPAEPDFVLTPLVAFDRALNRLGQGAGHYDRAFALLPAARRIGLAWACQEVEALPADPWDMPLDAIATEREWITRDAA